MINGKCSTLIHKPNINTGMFSRKGWFRVFYSALLIATFVADEKI